MKKNEIEVALSRGLIVCHGSSKNVVKRNNKGVLFVTDYKTNMPYELVNSHFEDCFIKGA